MSARIVLIFVVLLALLVSYTMAQPEFSDWSAPVNLGPVVNSAFGETAPAISRDGLSLYFSSVRPGFGGNDLWVSRRNSVDEAWGSPINLGPVINSAFGDLQPELSRDGHWLFFASGRPGAEGSGDIWVSYREHVDDDFGWQPPVSVGPGVNSPTRAEQPPDFFQNDDTGVSQLFFSDAGDGIYVSDLLPDGTFGPARQVLELDSAAFDRSTSVRFDGLEVFFQSNRPGVGLFDLWMATRPTVFDPWSAPINLGPLVNSVAGDGDPDIASDRETLYSARRASEGLAETICG